MTTSRVSLGAPAALTPVHEPGRQPRDVFDWLPHHPHAVQGRYVDTRVFPSRGLEVLLLGQNLHLVHHLWPSVPFYRYGAVFAACRDALAEKAAEVGREPAVGRMDEARVAGA